MSTLKKIFPLSFKFSVDVANLIVGIFIYIIIGIVAGALIGLATLCVAWIPLIGLFVGWALGILGSIVELYVLCGILIQVLVFTKIIK